MIKIKQILKKHKISPDIKKDQYFLTSKKVINEIIKTAGITKEDRVLEIGPGLGFLTQELSRTAKEVIAIEIDTAFKTILNQLPRNVKIIYGDAYKLLNDKTFTSQIKSPTKVISNIPYSQAQNMLHNYTNSDWYDGDLVWLAPMSLVDKINEEPILGAYFKAKLVRKVGKKSFYPQPKTTSAIIYFEKIADPIKTKNTSVYLRRFFYNYEHLKVKNMVREAIIQSSFDLKNKVVTKKQAKEIIKKLAIPREELEKLANNMKPDYYFSIPKKLETLET